MMYKSKSGKNWVEMDTKELREEIAHLILQLDKVSTKNKRRRTALKNNNNGLLKLKHDVVVAERHVREVEQRNRNLALRTENAESCLRTAERLMHEQTIELKDMATYAH